MVPHPQPISRTESSGRSTCEIVARYSRTPRVAMNTVRVRNWLSLAMERCVSFTAGLGSLGGNEEPELLRLATWRGARPPDGHV